MSPDEQVAFLKKFYDGTLPLSKAHVDALKGAMEQAPGTVENARGVAALDATWPGGVSLNAKTGATTIPSGVSVSWLVGQLTVDARKIVFAGAVWKANGVDNLAAAHLAIKTFVDRGVLRRAQRDRKERNQLRHGDVTSLTTRSADCSAPSIQPGVDDV